MSQERLTPPDPKGRSVEYLLAVAVAGALLFAGQAARVQEAARPLLSSRYIPGRDRVEFPEPRSEPANSERVFDSAGRNPGSASHPSSPGRVREDAPAQHELARLDVEVPEELRFALEPERPAPWPERDRRFHDLLRLSDDTRADDFPVIASSPTDREEVWVAWVSYGGRRDQIRLSHRDPQTHNWSTWNPVPGVSGDVWRPSLVVDDTGRIWVLWAQQHLFAADFEIVARWFDGERWGPLERLGSGRGGDFGQRVVRGPDGALHVVWQSFRNGQSDVVYVVHHDGRWSQKRDISESPCNDWAPDLAVDSNGIVHIVWDSYDRGDYDIVWRRLDSGSLSPIEVIAGTDFFEARPSIVVDREDRPWVAWEVGERGWGKDQGLTVDPERQPGSRLNQERQIQVQVRERGEWRAAKPEVAEMMPRKTGKLRSTSDEPLLAAPRLAVDGAGRVTLLLRNMDGVLRAESWRAWLMTMTTSGWDDPVIVPISRGRLSMTTSAAPAPDGGLWLAWPSDNHPTFSVAGPFPEETVFENVYVAGYAPDSAPGERLGEPRDPPFPARGSGHEDEAGDVQRLREWRVRVGGRPLLLLRGDTHRHTELSMDGQSHPDGSVLDFYRYMLDAAALDFGLVSDHQYGAEREYWWWLEEKLADLFHQPETYIALFGYERSVNFPHGHRNIIHARRGTLPVPFYQPDGPMRFKFRVGALNVLPDDTRLLYEALRESDGISIPHTSATTMGTDWRDNDPEIEPVVEIFQGDRTSYEGPGTPLADDSEDGRDFFTPVRPEGWVMNAWAKGYRLGVIASSDHLSTHISYAMVWAEERSREAVLDALRARRTYAATDNIVLELWMGEHFMGEELESATVPPIRVRAVGTRPFVDVQILRNSRSIYRGQGGSREVDVVFRDLEPEPGDAFYYARLVQEDGQVAWSSPIWVTWPE